MKKWTEKNKVEEALYLPKGNYGADFGFIVNQRVNVQDTVTAAQAIIENNVSCEANSQAELIVKAKEEGVAFEKWTPLRLI